MESICFEKQSLWKVMFCQHLQHKMFEWCALSHPACRQVLKVLYSLHCETPAKADKWAKKYLLQKTSYVLTLTHHNSSGHRIAWIHITTFRTYKQQLQCAIYIKSFKLLSSLFQNYNISVF